MIHTTLQHIFQEYKGILAADERPASMDRRLQQHGIEPGADARDRYRHMLFSTPNMERSVSGVILSEDTFSDHTTEGVPTREYLADRGITVGVKIDEGLEPFTPDSDTLFITKGLETAGEKCATYKKMGATFTKWRATVPVSDDLPESFIPAMADNMAAYARTVLDHELVPIVEPEVLLKGTHTGDETAVTLTRTLRAVRDALKERDCNPHRCILKTSFAVGGTDGESESAVPVALRTLRVFGDVGLDSERGFFGIVFLSGGLPSETAIQYIQKIRAVADGSEGPDRTFGPPLTFSYGRALQEPAMAEWKGKDENICAAQIAFTRTLQHATKKYKGTEDAPRAGDGRI